VGIAIFLSNGPSGRSPDGSEEEAGTKEPADKAGTDEPAEEEPAEEPVEEGPADELAKVPEGTNGRANGSTAAATGSSSSG
jgi:hypothetical protein